MYTLHVILYSIKLVKCFDYNTYTKQKFYFYYLYNILYYINCASNAEKKMLKAFHSNISNAVIIIVYRVPTLYKQLQYCNEV